MDGEGRRGRADAADPQGVRIGRVTRSTQRILARDPKPCNRTTYTVPTGVLQDSTLYVWRARAESDGAEGPWSSIFAFTTAFLNIDPPLPLVPTGGVVTASLRPRMTVANGAVTGDAGTVLVELHVGLDAAFTNPQVLRTHTRDRGETDLFFQSDLLPDMQYFWRARSTNQNLPETSALPLEGVLEVTTDWSATATFRTPTAEDASTATPAPTAGGTGSCCPPPNRLVVVQQVAAQTGYPGSGISVTDFTAAVARALAQEDGDWGRRINDSGPLGKDTVPTVWGDRTTTRIASTSSPARRVPTRQSTGANMVGSAGSGHPPIDRGDTSGRLS